MDTSWIFKTANQAQFEEGCMRVFQFQARENEVYARFMKYLGLSPDSIRSVKDIPFLPIEFFKSHSIVSSSKNPEAVFSSSGTTGSTVSRHEVTNLDLYRQSFTEGFRFFYGDPEDFTILALLPSYLEREGSSLVFMAHELIQMSRSADSGFYLNDLEALDRKLRELDPTGEPILLLGVSFALLDLVDERSFDLQNTLVMETGGMKGRRKELVREELHKILKEGFGTREIHSEYGMTELLSQAYSKGRGLFRSPPWLKVSVRDPEDPFRDMGYGKTGGINIIDLANVNSCSFIATQDLGRVYRDGSFEVLGRFDHSDIRGCNLMVV